MSGPPHVLVEKVQERNPGEVQLPAFPVEEVRRDFPILQRSVRGKPLVYLDNAATTQKPGCVIDALVRFYTEENANVHRGVHYLSEIATERYEKARETLARFFHIPVGCQLIFTRGTTESINLVAQSFVRPRVKPGDEILITYMEHHSNIVPWQMVCDATGAKLRVVPINDSGELILEEFERLLTERTKFVSVVHISNALGTVNPVKYIIDRSHAAGIPVLVDGAQSAAHVPINLQELNCDFFACSGHKMCGPTGIGILYGRAQYLEDMPPYQGGGDMILSVTFEKTVYNHTPHKFEAGTPHIAGAIGLAEAAAYIERIGRERIAQYEAELLQYATEALQEVPNVKLLGTAREKAGVLSFTMSNAHPHDIGQILSNEGIAIRAGHHCAQPLMMRFGIPASARASLAFYNTREDIDALVRGLHAVNKIFA